MAVGHQPYKRLEAQRPDLLARSEHDGSGTIVEAGSIPGGDQAILLEHGLHLCQLLDRNIGPHVLVDFEQRQPLARLDFNTGDLALEATFGDRARGALLADNGQRIRISRVIP